MFPEDLGLFFDEAEFSVRAVFEGADILGNFDQQFIEAFDAEDATGVNTNRPTFECLEADVPDAVGKTLKIGADVYLIEESRPDGEGLTLLIMQAS